MKTDGATHSFSSLVQAFFLERLLAQQNASPQTVASYRDTVRLLLQFASAKLKRQPAMLVVNDIDAPLVLDFLDDLEKRRGNAERTRNARLAAVRTLVKYMAFQEPTFLPHAGRILAIPMKRFNRPSLTFLSREEVEAIFEAPEASTWSGHRDRMMFMTLYNTGARVSELVALRIGDVNLKGRGYVTLHGKGRKQRVIPLWKTTGAQLRKWLHCIDCNPTSYLFPNRMGQPLTRSGVEHRLRVAVQKAISRCPSLKDKDISPHTFRHTTAMHLLQANVDLATIALWLGHESLSTTHTYITANLNMKEAALSRIKAPRLSPGRYRASGGVLAFLDSL